MKLKTDYPDDNVVEIAFMNEKPITLRKPWWCTEAKLSIIQNGQYYSTDNDRSFKGTWKKGDQIVLELDMLFYMVGLPENDSIKAIIQGPVVFAGSSMTEVGEIGKILFLRESLEVKPV